MHVPQRELVQMGAGAEDRQRAANRVRQRRQKLEMQHVRGKSGVHLGTPFQNLAIACKGACLAWRAQRRCAGKSSAGAGGLNGTGPVALDAGDSTVSCRPKNIRNSCSAPPTRLLRGKLTLQPEHTSRSTVLIRHAPPFPPISSAMKDSREEGKWSQWGPLASAIVKRVVSETMVGLRTAIVESLKEF